MKPNKNPKSNSYFRKLIIDPLIIIGISLLFMVLLEGFLRLFFPQTLQGEKIEGDSFSNFDKSLGLRYSPNSKWRFKHPEYEVIYEINELGLRDKKKHILPKPEINVRLLLVGDSFTFGQGVNYNQNWPVLVENQLKLQNKDYIDIVKAGIQGMDTRSEFLLINNFIEKLDCDVVVLVFLINDVYTNSLSRIEDIKLPVSTNQDFIETDSSQSWLETAKEIFIVNNKKNKFHLINFARRLVISNDYLYCKLYQNSNNAKYLTFPLTKEIKEKLGITEKLFKKIADFCSSLNKQLIVFSIPQQFQYLYKKKSMNLSSINVEFYDNHFKDFAHKHNFTWINAFDSFLVGQTNKNYFYRLDGHLNADGNQKVAEIFIQKVLPHIEEVFLKDA